MSKPSPPLLLNRQRFFLRFHRYISTTPTPHTSTHHPRPPSAQATTVPPPHQPPYRSASTSHPPPSAPPLPHYALFPQTLPHGAPPRGPFALDPRLLRREFLQLQSRAHPDRHAGPDKARAEGTSALINDAYRTLSSPLLRAQYLLAARGVDVAGDEGAKMGGDGNAEEAELLAEVLEVREAIEAAGQEAELEGMKVGNEGRVRESERVLGEAFKRDDVEGARREAVRLRYWTNIKEALDAWEMGKPVVLVH